LGNAADATIDLAGVLEGLALSSSTGQLRLLEQLRRFYDKRGLLPGGTNRSLCRCCRHAGGCWRGVDETRMSDDHGGITLPWVGAQFPDTRIAVLANNLGPASGGLLDEFRNVHDARTRFGDGHKQVHPGPGHGVTAYRGTSAVHWVLAAGSGQDLPPSRPDPRKLVPILDQFARLQTVKCVPSGKRVGTVSPVVRATCPPYLLKTELEILNPTWLIALGEVARSALQTLYPDAGWRVASDITTATLRLAQECCAVCLAHPSAPAPWKQSSLAFRDKLLALY
jgi:hypothetical protein